MKDNFTVEDKPDKIEVNFTYVGEPGKNFKFEDFTPEQLELLRGPQGMQGEPFRYEDFKPEELELLRGPKGETGKAFEVSKIYTSFEEMEKDAPNLEEGNFVMLQTSVEDEDNAKMFTKTKGEMIFISDFSGATGIQGPKGDQGLKGDKGSAFTYEDLTEANKQDLASKAVVVGKVVAGDDLAVSGGEVADKFKEIGVNFNQGQITNFVPDLVDPDFDDSTKWTKGLYGANGALLVINGWRAYNFYVELPKGTYTTNLYFTGNAYFCIYDANKVLTRSFTGRGHQDGLNTWSFDILDGEKYIRIARRVDKIFDSFVNGNKPNEYKDDVYFLSKNFESNTLDILSNFNIKTTEIGTNFLQELTVSDYTNEDVWGQNAFFTSIGNVSSGQTDFYYTKKYYEINGDVSFRFRNRYNGQAKCLIYDKDKNIIQVLENLTSTWIQDVIITTPSNAKYIRLSMRGNYTNIILLTNEEIIYNPIEVEAIDDVKITNINAVTGKGVADNFIKNNTLISSEKTKAPIVTFISDDGRAGNLTWYLPMLEANNCRSTLAIVGSWLDGGRGYVTMTREDVLECKRKGHDIASHTLTHPNLTTLTIEDVDLELYKSRLILNEMNIDCPMFVSPYGGRNINVDRVVRKYYNTNFITVSDSQVTDGTCVNIPIIDRFNLKRVSFDAAANGVSRLQICKDAVDVLESQGGWLVFAIHPHYNEYLQSGNPDGYEARRQELQDLITYIRSKDINILPANKAYNFYKNQIQIGDLRLDNDHYIVGADGTIDNTMY